MVIHHLKGHQDWSIQTREVGCQNKQEQRITIVENVDIYERLTRIENPEDIKYLIGIVC